MKFYRWIMKITFRWYGESDSVKLSDIRQIPVVSGVVAAVYDTPVGTVWAEDSIARLVDLCRSRELECEVIESVPVHEEIKLGGKRADEYITNYKENIRRLSKYGIKCICYNFMPVFDWLRSDLSEPQRDGSYALSYKHGDVLNMNPLTSELSLPGWDSSYTRAGLKELLDRYRDIDEERLWKNLRAFLNEIIPVAEACGVKMAIHPDDPPWGIFGLPRIIKDKKGIDKLLSSVPSEYNGITLCTGSLGAARENDLTDIITAKGRIHFAHMRNIALSGLRDFKETAHPSDCGGLDMRAIMDALIKAGFDGYIRPDHGRMIWGEKGRPGYGLYDRALGACYLAGLMEGLGVKPAIIR